MSFFSMLYARVFPPNSNREVSRRAHEAMDQIYYEENIERDSLNFSAEEKTKANNIEKMAEVCHKTGHQPGEWMDNRGISRFTQCTQCDQYLHEPEFEYSFHGGSVSSEDLECALDFLVKIEPDPEYVVPYDAFMAAYSQKIKMAEAAIKQFGEEIEPKTLQNMQDIYYSYTNSEKYLADAIVSEIVRVTLSHQWNGIGPWRH